MTISRPCEKHVKEWYELNPDLPQVLDTQTTKEQWTAVFNAKDVENADCMECWGFCKSPRGPAPNEM